MTASVVDTTEAKRWQDDPMQRERVCATCGEWVYYDNGDCTFHCHCGAGWTFRRVSPARVAHPVQEDRIDVAEEATWNGIPPVPLKGWHLLRSKPWNGHEYEEAWLFNPEEELAWTRRENGCLHGWEARHMHVLWCYVGRLEQVV